jgi:hypothetical protein
MLAVSTAVEVSVYHTTVSVTVFVILGVVTLHVVAPLYHVQLLVNSLLPPSSLLLFGL